MTSACEDEAPNGKYFMPRNGSWRCWRVSSCTESSTKSAKRALRARRRMSRKYANLQENLFALQTIAGMTLQYKLFQIASFIFAVTVDMTFCADKQHIVYFIATLSNICYHI